MTETIPNQARTNGNERVADVIPLFDMPASQLPAPLRTVQHRGQMRMAERLVHEHSDELRYAHGLDWYVWTGTHWRVDESARHDRMAQLTIKAALREAADRHGPDADDLYKDARKCESASGLAGVLAIARTMLPIAIAHRELDAHPALLTTPGGTVDLKTGQMRPADRADLITKTTKATPRRPADVDTEWTRFLARILPDEDERAFVQRLLGSSLFGEVREHVMPIFTGTGANGKGTLRDAVKFALGDYAIEVDPAILMESKHERHGTFKMQLRGARLVFTSETDKNKQFAEATMKRLTGGDPIEANLMHRDPITFDPSHTLVMLTNHLPKVSGDDPAVWRRILVIPFDVVIPPDERDPGLKARFEACADEILMWLLEGWIDYSRRGGLDIPEVVRERTRKYQADSDVLARFLDERVYITKAGRIGARDLFTAWQQWCQASREEPGSEVVFAASMGARGYSKTVLRGRNFYTGMTLLSDDDEPGNSDEDRF